MRFLNFPIAGHDAERVRFPFVGPSLGPGAIGLDLDIGAFLHVDTFFY